MLARVPEKIAKSRTDYYQKMHDDKVKAVDNDLMREQHRSMPINIDKQSRTTFGGTKKVNFLTIQSPSDKLNKSIRRTILWQIKTLLSV